MNEKDDLRHLLARSYDEKLEPEEEKVLEEALLYNEWLRVEAAQFKQLREALQSWSVPSANDFTDKVMQQVEDSAAYRLPRHWLQWTAAASAAIILIAGISIYWTSGSLSTEALLGVSELAPEDAVTLLQAY